MATDLTPDSIRLLCAAGYVRGVLGALFAQRSDAWNARLLRRSWIPESRVFTHAQSILSGLGVNSPLDAYDVISAAERLGLDLPIADAQKMIEQALSSKDGPEFTPGRRHRG